MGNVPADNFVGTCAMCVNMRTLCRSNSVLKIGWWDLSVTFDIPRTKPLKVYFRLTKSEAKAEPLAQKNALKNAHYTHLLMVPFLACKCQCCVNLHGSLILEHSRLIQKKNRTINVNTADAFDSGLLDDPLSSAPYTISISRLASCTSSTVSTWPPTEPTSSPMNHPSRRLAIP